MLESNMRMAGELVERDSLFEALRYDHQLVLESGGMTSRERIEYKLRYGIAGRIIDLLFAKRLIRRLAASAHLKLKEKAEERRLKSG